jgi:hypothetical protein
MEELWCAICLINMKKKEVRHVRARVIPSYYREEWWGMDTEGCQDRTGIGLFSPEIRYS